MSILRGPTPYKDHLLCRTQEDLDGLRDEYRAEAEALVAASEWPEFDRLLVVCVDEKEDRVVGVTSETGDSEVLFLVAEDRRGEGIGQLMVEALLPEVEDVTEAEVLDEDWAAPYHAVAGSYDGAGFLHSLTGSLGWKAFALIEWSGFDEEKSLWRQDRARELGKKRVLPGLRRSGPDEQYIDEYRIYEWPDGSDALLQLDAYHGEVYLVVRWIDLPSTWLDPTTGENEDPTFAVDSASESGGHQHVTLSGGRRFPAELEKKMVGLFLDLGVERSLQSPSLVQSDLVQVVRYPRFVPEERWAARYDEARAWVGSQTKDDLLDEVPLFYLYRGQIEIRTFVDRPNQLVTKGEEGWTATWGWNDRSSTWNATLEGAVDEVLSRELVLPESAREEWDREHVERGTMLCPTEDEALIFRMMGETLPLWWDIEPLEAWLAGRQS